MSILASCRKGERSGQSTFVHSVGREGEREETNLRIERELGHDGTKRSKVTLVVESTDVVEKLESSHDGFGSGSVHVVAERKKGVDASRSASIRRRERVEKNESTYKCTKSLIPSLTSSNTVLAKLLLKISG